MMLVDSSVWIDHFRRGDAELAAALHAEMVLMHPMVLSELALGNLAHRDDTLARLGALPGAAVATDEELAGFIERRRLHGRGIGYVDAHLVASCALSGATLWTGDRRLGDVATEIGVA